MKLQLADQIAASIETWLRSLQPAPTRILTVGSIRRRKPEPGDIDIVVEATDEQYHAIRWALDVRPEFDIIEAGRLKVAFWSAEHQQVDLYFARPAADGIPSNWGSRVLQRTGSRDFNIYLARSAIKQGKEWKLDSGIWRAADGPTPSTLIAGETEESIFEALDIPFLPPEGRSW